MYLLTKDLRASVRSRESDEHLVRLVALGQELATDRSGSSRAAFRPWKPPLACSRSALCSQPAPEDSLATTRAMSRPESIRERRTHRCHGLLPDRLRLRPRGSSDPKERQSVGAQAAGARRHAQTSTGSSSEP